MPLEGLETEELLRPAGLEGGAAHGALLRRHRGQLRRMIASVLDRRPAGRADPSGVVQEALPDAGEQLTDDLREPTLPFYPWLRRLALRRVAWGHRFHVRARRRNVARECRERPPQGDASTPPMIETLAGNGTTLSGFAVRNAERDRVRDALGRLSPSDREVLDLRYIEGIGFAAIAERLGIGLGDVKIRHLRSMECLSRLLEAAGGDRCDD